MRKPKSNSKLYAYLQSLGVLERGNEEEIQNAKKEFRKQYLTTYKKSYRKEKKHIEIILNPNERDFLQSQAILQGMPLPTFLKQSSLNYLQQKYMTPHPKTILEIKELVFKTYSKIEKIADTEKKRWYGNINEYETIKKDILSVIQTTQQTFQNPQLIHETILDTLKQDSQFIEILKEIVQNYDNQVTRQEEL